MTKNLISRITSLSLLLIIILLLGACASSPAKQAESAPEAKAEPVPVEPWDGDAMDIPLDGSSMEAFDVSLARVKAYATPKQYEGLLEAIDYLLTYDIGAEGDYEKLVSRLDGLTPAQVWKRVNWRKPAPGRSPAEKDAADAKIIDS